MIESMNAIARLWWDWMVAMGWQVGLLIGIIGGIDWLIRKWAWPQLRYALWSLVLLKLLLPPMLSLPSGIINGLQPSVEKVVARLQRQKPAAAIAGGRLQIADLSLGDAGDSGFGSHRSDEPFAGGIAGQVPDVSGSMNLQSAIVNHVTPSVVEGPHLDWRVYVMSVWLSGVMALGVFLFVRLRSLSKGCGETSEAPPESFYNRMSQCAGRVGLRRMPRVVPTARLSNPAVFGAFRPILLMPVGYLSRLSRKDAEHMLLHEFCHIKRGDLFVHGLTLMLQVVYWFNPLLWLARRHIHHLRELCCDASVANLLREDTPAYRETLLETARRFLAAHAEPGLGLLGLFEDSNCLLVRLNWLEKPTWRYRRMKNLIVVVVAGFMAACVLPMAQAQPEAPVDEMTTVPPVNGEQMSQEMQELQEQMQRLQEQMKQVAKQMAQLSVERAKVRHEMAGTGLFESYTVKEGDTLAKIAEKTAGSDRGSIENMIARIKEANELTANRLKIGQKLWVPARIGAPAKSMEKPHAMPPVPAIPALPPIPHAADLPALPHAPQPPAHIKDNRVAVELEPQRRATRLSPGTRVLVDNEIGSVKVRTGEEQNCVVLATVTGRGDTKEEAAEIAKRVEVQVTPEDGVLRIEAPLPDEMRKGDHRGVEVRFEIIVPRKTPVEVIQKVGSVKLSGLANGVSARVEAGSITAENLAGDVDLAARAGSIDVTVSADASAKVRAAAKLGSIKTDLPLDITSKAMLQHGRVQNTLGSTATGTLGAGRDKLNLQVDAGSIKITSAGPTPEDDGPAEF